MSRKEKIEVEITFKGERYRRSKTIETNLKGADLKRLIAITKAELKEELKREINDPKQLHTFTFQQFAEYYIRETLDEQGTIEYYNRYLNNRTYDHFGNMKMKTIEHFHVVQFFNMLKKTISPATGRKLSAKTIKHYKTILSAIFNYAYRIVKVIPTNPMDGLVIDPVKRSLKKNFYTPAELKEIIYMFEKYAPFKYLVMTVVTLQHSMRPGELQGLKWKKILKDEVIIDEALSYTKKGYFLKPTKTEDHRIEELSAYEKSLLTIHRENEIKKHGTDDIADKYVFSGDVHEHVGAGSFRQYYRDFCERYDLRYITPYGLRHTSATILALNNIPVVNISRKLGHSNLNTTDIYIHAIDTVNKEMTNILSEAIKPKTKAGNI